MTEAHAKWSVDEKQLPILKHHIDMVIQLLVITMCVYKSIIYSSNEFATSAHSQVVLQQNI